MAGVPEFLIDPLGPLRLVLDSLWNIVHVDDPVVPDTEAGDDVEEGRRSHALNYVAATMSGCTARRRRNR